MDRTIGTTLPTVSVNGTSPDRLLEQQTTVMGAARVLLEAMRHACPNGRDFIGREGDLRAALAAYRTRIEQVEGIIRDAEKTAEHLVGAEALRG